MAFAVFCKSCQARILLNDGWLRSKEAGRVVTLRCRQCQATVEVDPSNLTDEAAGSDEKPAPAHAPQASPRPPTAKPAPSPPRPAKSATLMGLGAPTKPAGARELVALSPGFLNMGTNAPAGRSPRGFPEPPPPPTRVEEPPSGDWDIPGSAAEASGRVPESVDDFVEELPPSLPPPDEEVPSSAGTPSLKQLTHHDQHRRAPADDDFLVNLTASAEGDLVGAAGGAPTIDVSAFNVPGPEAAPAPHLPVSDFDVALGQSSTLPLFQLGTEDVAFFPPARADAQPPLPAWVPQSAIDLTAVEKDTRAGARERRNVVAPSAPALDPSPAQPPRPSGFALPLLLAIAMAAGVLIWQRSGTSSTVAVAPVQPTHPNAPEARVAAPPATLPATGSSQAAEAVPGEDITFETAPRTPTSPGPRTGPAAARGKPATPAESAPRVGESPRSAAAEPAPAPPSSSAKVEPMVEVQAPPPQAEPTEPFDRAAAAAALNEGAARASSCKKEGDPSGVASVVITFAPSGRVTSANISGPPFAGTPTGGCIASALRKARIAPFAGDRVTVSKTIVVQ